MPCLVMTVVLVHLYRVISLYQVGSCTNSYFVVSGRNLMMDSYRTAGDALSMHPLANSRNQLVDDSLKIGNELSA